MTDSLQPSQPPDSDPLKGNIRSHGKQTQFMLDLCDLVAKNPDAWTDLKKKLSYSQAPHGPQPELLPPQKSPPIANSGPAAAAPTPTVAAPSPAPARVTPPQEPLRIPLAQAHPAAAPPSPAPSPAPRRVAAPAMTHVEAAPYEPAVDEYGQVLLVESAEEKPKSGIWAKLGGGALTFAVLFHLVLLIIGAIWIFQRIYEPEKKIDFLPGGGSAGGGQRSVQTKVQQQKKAQITPSTNVKRVFAEGAASNFAIPDPGENFGQMSTLSSLGGGMSGGLGGSGSGGGFGSGKGSGTGFGGAGTGKMFGLVPETMRKRCSKDDRLQRLKDNGGIPACEDAVVKSLSWLKSQQNSDGSWGQDVGTEYTGRIGITSLVLLAYLGHCETPMSEEFGESCMKAIVFLVDQGAKNQGKIATFFNEGHWCYEHALATYALGEASTFCNDLKIFVPQINEVTQQAAQFIINNQNANGGWAYSYATSGGHADVSVTGWQLQALKACNHNNRIKLQGLQSAIRKGLRYLQTCQNENGGYGYTGPTPHAGGYFTLTGVGVLCHQMWGKGSLPDVKKGVKYIGANSKLNFASQESDLYQHYYESQAMMQEGGTAWTDYNRVFRDQILNNQNPDGTWKAPASGNGPFLYGKTTPNGQIYRNCLCTLMLEVYYRFLSTGGGSMGI